MNKSRLARLYKPDTNIKKYDNDDFRNDPLLVFRICEIKERRHYSFLKRKATEEKLKLCHRNSKEIDTNLDESLISRHQSYYIKKIRESVKKIPVPKMLYKIKEKILYFLPKQLKQKYPDDVNYYLNEIMLEYDKIMKIFSLKRILIYPESDDEEPEKYYLPKLDFNFKYPGKTKNYQQFLLYRQKLKKNLLITQPFIRNILYNADRGFPKVLDDYSKYNIENKNQPITLKKFIKKTHDNLNNSSVFLRWEWYPKVVNNIRKYYKKKLLEKNCIWPRALNCATELINRELNNLKIYTIENLIDVVSNKRKIPKFQLEIICYEIESSTLEIDFEPSYEIIMNTFINLIYDISQIGTQLEPLEQLIDSQKFKIDHEFLKISLSEFCIQEFVKRICYELLKTYKPILNYLESFKTKYYELYSKKTNDDLNEFLSESRNFEEYFAKIQSYNYFINELKNEMEKEYFDIVIITKKQAINSLRKFANSLVEKVTNVIVQQHMKEELEICKIFETICNKALEIPRSTEELLSSAEWIILVKTKQIFELNERINNALKIGSELVSLTELNFDHIQLQIKMINWLNNIEHVFEQNASMHETYKFQFEEHVQNVTKKLNDDITEIIPKLAVIDEMSDTEKFRDYNVLLQNFIDQIHVFDNYVKWINKEEKLFKVPKTQYPVLDAIKDFVIPFAELMR